MRTNRALFGVPRLYFKTPRGGTPTDEKHVQESNAGKVRARNHLIIEHGTSKLHFVSQENVQTLGYPEFHLTWHIFFLLRHTTLTDSLTDPLASMPTCISRCFHPKYQMTRSKQRRSICPCHSVLDYDILYHQCAPTSIGGTFSSILLVALLRWLLSSSADVNQKVALIRETAGERL